MQDEYEHQSEWRDKSSHTEMKIVSTKDLDKQFKKLQKANLKKFGINPVASGPLSGPINFK